MNKTAAATVAAMLFATPAIADSMTTAVALGSVLASEEVCGLTYDQRAIEAYILKNVKADDMQFPSTLQTMTQGQMYQLKEMSKSQMTAHCSQIRRLAKSYGFTAN